MFDTNDSEINDLTQPTALLDFNGADIKTLVQTRNWQELAKFDAVGAVYNFIRNEIRFGYNRSDDIAASEVLRDGYGQCNTKGTLLMALLRAVDMPCRLHGFTIRKSLQRGVVPELVYGITPDSILHSWVEVWLDGKWINLEGFILDTAYLSQVQRSFGPDTDSLCGFGVGTDALSAPQVEWTGADTYIQETGINQDFGVFDSPDQFYREHQQSFPVWKDAIYRFGIRHWMNARVQGIRTGKITPQKGSKI